ncbi:MAG: efflux RND transporter periplasmic adaptor subunit [Candidatus Sumerlaeia bacterium]
MFKSKNRKGAAGIKILLLLIILAAAAGAAWYFLGDKEGSSIDFSEVEKVAVNRGDLIVSILQSGELGSKRNQVIKNEMDRQTKIMYIVEDGARVKKGDLLVELDAEDIQDNLLRQQSEVSSAEASLLQAQKGLEISELKAKTDMEDAELRVQLAKLDLKKYEEAEYPQQKRKAEVAIALAEEDLKRARDEYESTRQLVEKGYTNRAELEADELAVKRREIELVNSKEDLKILIEYTHVKQQRELKNNVKQAEAALDRLKKTLESERARDLANLESRKVSLNSSQNRLKKIEEQIEKSKIYSEFDGMVFYPVSGGRWNRGNEIEKGASVYPRQDLLNFPDLTAWKIEVGVPESIIDRVKKGQDAFATIDAMPGLILEALVQKVSVVPDRGRWYDSSNKTYTVELDIPTTPSVELKPGMSTTVEIITSEKENVLQAPIQSVTKANNRFFVFGPQGKRIEVEVGLSNEDSIEIVSGLKEGDQILLYAPTDSDTRGGLKERPLNKAREEGRETKTGDTESSSENASSVEKAEKPQKAAQPQRARGEGGRGDQRPE